MEILLASPLHPSPPPARATSLTLNSRSAKNQENTNSSKKRTRSPRCAFMDTTKSICINGQSITNDDILPLMKKSTLDLMTPKKTRQSNSFDSGYDRSSSSDTHSIVSFSINQASSSVPSARLTSASTRRSNTQKKVSFEDQSSTVIITTATYV